MLQIIPIRPRFRLSIATLALVGLVALGCGGEAAPKPSAPEPSSTSVPAVKPSTRIVVLGDSIAAGMGLANDEAFPAQTEAALRKDGYDVEVVNAGVSGDTTAGGLARIDWVLQEPARILVIELGGNDALRGQPLENTEANLREIIRHGRATGATVILLGMDVPTNYGPDYTMAFAELYSRLSEETGVEFVPGFVRELGADPSLLQPDGLHPTAEGQRRLAGALHPFLVDLLNAPAGAINPPVSP